MICVDAEASLGPWREGDPGNVGPSVTLGRSWKSECFLNLICELKLTLTNTFDTPVDDCFTWHSDGRTRNKGLDYIAVGDLV